MYYHFLFSDTYTHHVLLVRSRGYTVRSDALSLCPATQPTLQTPGARIRVGFGSRPGSEAWELVEQIRAPDPRFAQSEPRIRASDSGLGSGARISALWSHWIKLKWEPLDFIK